jgi:rhodanese-related sulfurtransferase
MIAFIKALLGLGGESVGPHEAVRRLNDGAVLIDVREPAEFSRARASAARSLPLGQIQVRGTAALDGIAPAANGGEILLICQSGMRSRIARNLLSRDARHRYVNVTGGMSAWMAAGLPFVQGAMRR